MTLTASTATTATDRTIGFRRTAGAIALPLAFAAQAVCNTLYAVASMGNAGDTGVGEQTLQFFAEHAGTMRAGMVFALVGCLLAIPGVLAAVRVLRPSRPTLALAAAVLMIAGYVCYFAIVFTGFDTIALATAGVEAGAALDASYAEPAALPFFVLFVVGNLLGTALLGLAVILARPVPRWAGALILGWPAGHVINLVGGGEWFAVGGGALEVAGLCVLCVHALRLSNAQWAARG